MKCDFESTTQIAFSRILNIFLIQQVVKQLQCALHCTQLTTFHKDCNNTPHMELQLMMMTTMMTMTTIMMMMMMAVT